jgi:enoyl-CoA hydratase/carnithine racemase
MTEVLISKRHGSKGEILKLTLNRPTVGNQFNTPLLEALNTAFGDVIADPTVQVVIVTGSGADFCVGSDGHEASKVHLKDKHSFHLLNLKYHDLYFKMQSVPRPIIAAVNGRAKLGGLEFALSCDMIVASSTASLGDAHPAGIGGGGGSQRLQDAVGNRMARWLLYTGEMLPAARAFECGLVQAVYDAATFDQSVLRLAQDIAARSMGSSLARIKTLTRRFEPTLADLHFAIEHCDDHYLEPEVKVAIGNWFKKNTDYTARNQPP